MRCLSRSVLCWGIMPIGGGGGGGIKLRSRSWFSEKPEFGLQKERRCDLDESGVDRVAKSVGGQFVFNESGVLSTPCTLLTCNNLCLW